MELQEKYYKKIGSTILSLRWADILSKRNIQMNQALWKERNIFAHPLLPNVLGVTEYNTVKTNIMT